MEIEKLKEKYDFSDGLMRERSSPLGFMIRDIILLSVEVRIAKLFIM